MTIRNFRMGRGQAGEGRIGLIIGLLVVAGAIYFLKLAVPPRIQKAEFADFIEQKTRTFVVNQITIEQLTTSILDEAKRLEIPISEESLTIDDTESRVRVRAKYTITQDIIGGKTWVQVHEIEKEVPRL